MTNLIERSLNLLEHSSLSTMPTTILVIFAIVIFAIALMRPSEITLKLLNVFEIFLKK